MSDITYLDTERRTMRAIEYRRALRLSDPGQRRDECRRIAAEHRAETEAARGPSVGEVRTVARTQGDAPDAEPA